LKQKYGIEPVAHLPCINMTREEVLAELAEFKAHGIDNVLALRGDVNPNLKPKTDFKYASDLVAFICDNGDFHIIGACYPEGHSEAESLEADIDNLKRKVDSGVSHLITQLFFDNKCFYSFLEKIRKAKINVPVEAGIMPIMSKNQILRMVFMCGASLPADVVKMLQKYENDEESLRDAGIDYAVRQIADLKANGADGIHFYTMNSPYAAGRIKQ
jgi:methylenetetrahydrofolate reductase (NADPH)